MENKNNIKFYIVTAAIIIIALLAIGGGYLYYNNKAGTSKNSPTKVYKNEKFNYQVIVPESWSIPTEVNSIVDLTKKYLNESTNQEIFDYSGENIVVKNQTKLNEVEKIIKDESKKWNPSKTNYLMLTNASLQEQDDFYKAVLKKEKLILVDFFPNRTIRIEVSDHIPDLTKSTSTSRKINKSITLPNGIIAEYDKLIHPTMGSTVVYIPYKSNELTYDGKEINSISLFYINNEISENYFMEIVNSFTFLP